MKKFIKGIGIVVLMTSMTFGVIVLNHSEETKIAKFFKQAFRDMKESTKRQSEIDKANFKAHKMEAKAFYEEQKAMRNPKFRKIVQEQEYLKKMTEAKARQAVAQKRIDEAKNINNKK